MTTYRSIKWGLLGAAFACAAVAASGCELLVDFDRSKIQSDAGEPDVKLPTEAASGGDSGADAPAGDGGDAAADGGDAGSDGAGEAAPAEGGGDGATEGGGDGAAEGGGDGSTDGSTDAQEGGKKKDAAGD